MLRCGSALFLIVFILIAFLTLSVRNPAVPLAGVKAQSSCTPPTYLGYPSTCGIIGILWLRVDTVSQIDHYDILRYGIKIGEAPANAQSYSDRVGCDFAAIYMYAAIMPAMNPPNATFPSMRWRLRGNQLWFAILSHNVAVAIKS